MKVWLKLSDFIIILLAAGITLFLAYNAYINPAERAVVLIRSQTNEWVFPIDAQETIVVPGVIGNTIIQVRENRAWVEFSPCLNHTCMAAGFISRQGQWTACLPNNVLLIIQGEGRNLPAGDDDVDAFSW